MRVTEMNTKVYNYFANNFGIVRRANDVNSDLLLKYKEFSKQLKRNQLAGRDNDKSGIYTPDHNSQIRRNFWGYVKTFLEEDENPKLTFSKLSCVNYFKDSLRCYNPMRTFTIPSWIPTFNEPELAFDETPPTYQEIT